MRPLGHPPQGGLYLATHATVRDGRMRPPGQLPRGVAVLGGYTQPSVVDACVPHAVRPFLAMHATVRSRTCVRHTVRPSLTTHATVRSRRMHLPRGAAVLGKHTRPTVADACIRQSVCHKVQPSMVDTHERLWRTHAFARVSSTGCSRPKRTHATVRGVSVSPRRQPPQGVAVHGVCTQQSMADACVRHHLRPSLANACDHPWQTHASDKASAMGCGRLEWTHATIHSRRMRPPRGAAV